MLSIPVKPEDFTDAIALWHGRAVETVSSQSLIKVKKGKLCLYLSSWTAQDFLPWPYYRSSSFATGRRKADVYQMSSKPNEASLYRVYISTYIDLGLYQFPKVLRVRP